MRVLHTQGNENIATVYVGVTERGNRVEFVESRPEAGGISEKWVIIVSTLRGCPVRCIMCDAGHFYEGRLTYDEIMEQIEYLVFKYFPDGNVRTKKFKIQFSRVGEPAFNPEVLKVLKQISTYNNLIPSISTVAPKGTDWFFEELTEIKDKYYRGKFQLQFSIHSTSEKERNNIIPIKKWTLERIAEFGEKFVKDGDKKVTLNFALAKHFSFDPIVIESLFNPEKFLIKITPINPTLRSIENHLESDVDINTGSLQKHKESLKALIEKGFVVIISIGNLEENKIGSNCGMYLKRLESRETKTISK
jgi:23S rRNA (adenine2503-C2)-methyltransferase